MLKITVGVLLVLIVSTLLLYGCILVPVGDGDGGGHRGGGRIDGGHSDGGRGHNNGGDRR